MNGAFVQIGATRDGLDPYLDCARARGMPAVLVETPAYARWRRAAGRRAFDRDVVVERPHEPGSVLAALRDAEIDPALVLTGFERYAVSGFAVAAALGVPPQDGPGEPFVPPDKQAQRAMLTAKAPEIRQPRCAAAADAGALGYPQVIKPVDGGGGLGVFLAHDAAERAAALAAICATANYGGGAFTGVLAEEYVPGAEYSIQGTAWHGTAVTLSVCEKLVTAEPGPGGLPGFREAGHIVAGKPAAGYSWAELAQRCVDAVGYRDGPFHIDLMAAGDEAVFIEMGFRLSGGAVVSLVETATGARWADWAFACHLREPEPRRGAPGRDRVVGQLTVFTEEQLATAERLRSAGHPVEIQRFAPPPERLATAPELASDRMRHGTALGRVRLIGGADRQVRALLRACLPADQGVHVADRKES